MLIVFSCFCLYHKLFKTDGPEAIVNMFQKQNMRAKTNQIYRPIYKSKTQLTEKGFIYRGAKLFNILPIELKTLNREGFNKSIKSYLHEHEIWDSYDWPV